MGPRSGRLPQSGAYMVDSYPSVYPSVTQLFSNLRGMRSILDHRQVDLVKSCTVSAVDGCFQLAELSLWNNFLWVINIELRQVRLALDCIRGRRVPLACTMQRRRSVILVHWPLMEHHSIEFVELNESRMSPKQLRGGTELGGHLRHARLCYRLLDYPTKDLMDALRSTVTMLDTLEIVSVCFSSVGVSMLYNLLDRCDAMGTLVFLEN
ncbi:hypothetical protein HPB49_003188 [Dermacentor silvarum]|uniref:Uncharacterized protein n=1 Tax=Dermacentor silvarum TaxID=543639 RepID=A0ACB8DTH5_DERSI|nr:hypothetical protein HPB49_003188 [Dermacentor silvarum]